MQVRDLVAQLRGIREEAGLTQDELADRLGMSRVQISRIESGKRGTTYDVIEAWLEACGHDLVVVRRESPAADALAAELMRSGPEARALLLRFLRLLPRLDDRTRQIVSNFVSTMEQDAEQAERQNRAVDGS